MNTRNYAQLLLLLLPLMMMMMMVVVVVMMMMMMMTFTATMVHIWFEHDIRDDATRNILAATSS